MKNIGAITKAGKSSFGSVVKTTIYLKNLDDFDVINNIYKIYFGDP